MMNGYFPSFYANPTNLKRSLNFVRNCVRTEKKEIYSGDRFKKEKADGAIVVVVVVGVKRAAAAFVEKKGKKPSFLFTCRRNYALACACVRFACN